MGQFTDRMVRSAKLDGAVYAEVEHDNTATGQAAGVVVLSSLAAGVGTIAYTGFWQGLIYGTLVALVGWAIWAVVTWWVGTKLLPTEHTEADVGQLLRTIGFAASPGILRVAGIIPALGPFIVLIADIWMLAAMVVAVRTALDYTSTWRAVGVCIIGWLALVLLNMLVIMFFGGPGG